MAIIPSRPNLQLRRFLSCWDLQMKMKKVTLPEAISSSLPFWKKRKSRLDCTKYEITYFNKSIIYCFSLWRDKRRRNAINNYLWCFVGKPLPFIATSWQVERIQTISSAAIIRRNVRNRCPLDLDFFKFWQDLQELYANFNLDWS